MLTFTYELCLVFWFRSRVSFLVNNTLLIRRVVPLDAGVYQCSARNGVDRAPYAEVTLHVVSEQLRKYL